MADRQTKQWVEAVLYGTGNQRRFTHDSPIQLDVWAQFFENPVTSLELLMLPWLETSPVDVAEAILRDMSDSLKTRSATSYNRRAIAARLSLADIVKYVLPSTGWYIAIKERADRKAARAAGTAEAEAAPSLPAAPFRLPDRRQMWDDVDTTRPRTEPAAEGEEIPTPTPATPDLGKYDYLPLLSFIRMAGLIFDRQNHAETDDDPGLASDLQKFSGDNEAEARLARDRLTQRINHGWETRFPEGLPLPREQKLIHSISRNRPARLAIQQSVRTVKGDAASSLFSIDCSGLTWAIMDSGIDATHPAFQKHPERPLPAGASDADKLARSRVRETYDFSYLRELLVDPTDPALPDHIKNVVGASGTALDPGQATKPVRQELLRRLAQARAIDWDLLRPFLRVDHGAGYERPIDTHGTHVAGILGAKWQEAGPGTQWMYGMCPDIKLVDIRVCRNDGSSDEFVIMSALQFIRHLNSSSDRMAIHGVNMSLSLDHDAAVYACGRTPVCDEAERTVANGVVVVVAAGNLGYRRVLGDGELPFDQFCPVSITDPGNAQNVITVGSTHRLEPHNYGISYFSSRGPTGDGRIKPDLVAPGEKIYAPALGDGAVRLDGTSMAAPHVSGAAALLMARHVELVGEPQRVKKILCDTATDLGREPYFQGRGLVDVLRAIQSI